MGCKLETHKSYNSSWEISFLVCLNGKNKKWNWADKMWGRRSELFCLCFKTTNWIDYRAALRTALPAHFIMSLSSDSPHSHPVFSVCEITRSGITRNIIIPKWATHCLGFRHKLADKKEQSLGGGWCSRVGGTNGSTRCRGNQGIRKSRRSKVKIHTPTPATHTHTHTNAKITSGGLSCKNCHLPSEGSEINEHTTPCFCPLISVLQLCR